MEFARDALAIGRTAAAHRKRDAGI